MDNLIDTHFHLDCCKNHAQLYEQINKEKQYTLCVTNTPEAFERCIKTYPETKYIKFALGYNPQMIGEKKFNSFLFVKNLNRTKYIGEVGLDFSTKFIKHKEEQLKIFDFICKVAGKNNKIMTVHSRKAEKEVLEVLKRNDVKKVIIHWYTGDIDLIRDYLKMGYYFSINRAMLRNQHGRNIIKEVPKDKILLESDIPFSKGHKLLSEEYLWINDVTTVKQMCSNFIKLVRGDKDE